MPQPGGHNPNSGRHQIFTDCENVRDAPDFVAKFEMRFCSLGKPLSISCPCVLVCMKTRVCLTVFFCLFFNTSDVFITV